MKGQTLIVQFILFFLIGLAVLATVGFFFRYQSDVFKESVASKTRELIASDLSAHAITFNSCQECQHVKFTTKVANTTADYFITVSFASNQLVVTTLRSFLTATSNFHNLNQVTLVLSPSGPLSTTQPITLMLNKIQNTIRLE